MATLGTEDLVLTIAVQTALNPGASAQWLLTKVTATNYDIADRKVTVYRVPSGGTNANTNAIAYQFPVPVGETVSIPLSAQALVNGATLQALCDADSVVNLSITYEVVPS